MIPAEFEEKTYEGTLYNQLERGQRNLFTPGQVMEGTVGFDRGLFLSQIALWQTLGYKAPPHGAALAYYDWPITWGPARPRSQLPNFKLNLFLQTKRPEYYKRRPRAVAKLAGTRAPLWAFHITSHQQRLLEVLADTTQSRALVAYACAAFHTNAALFAHMKNRTIVKNSTFPSVSRLSGHSAWYYWSAGASGAANPDPESIEEPSLQDRISTLSLENKGYEPGDITWLDVTAREVVASVLKLEGQTDAVSAHFLDDLQILSRLAESYSIQPSFLAFAQINLFSVRFGLSWLVVADMPL